MFTTIVILILVILSPLVPILGLMAYAALEHLREEYNRDD